jgi:Lon protease-like protein
MNERVELPLFPLNMVLFPACRVPLHIFEERYKLMVSECHENDSEFAIVSGTDDMFQQVGCAARVVEVVKQYDDGRMNIIVAGTRRVQVIDRIDRHAYISGAVEPVEDEPEGVDEGLVCRVRRLYDEAIKLSFGWLKPSDHSDMDPSSLSYTIAAGLNMDLSDQQDILEIRSVSDRLRRVEGLLGRAVDGIREVKRRTGGNGHL